MKTLKFNSCCADKMEKFVSLRCLSGTEYKGQTRILKCFDKFLIKEHFNKQYLTREIIQQYQASISNLNPGTIYSYFCVVRQFCRYLSQFEPLCYVPEPMPITAKSKSLRIPYIYTKTEIKNLLKKARKLSPLKSLRSYTYYTLFGILYTTGLRIGEALTLNIEDFHKDARLLHIREGKFNKERWVPLSYSTYVKLIKYINIRKKTSQMRPNSPFFISRRYRRLSYSSVRQIFYILLKQCNIHTSKDYRPHIHDFRHSFAVHRLVKWYREGRDVNALLPALATYMGHVDISCLQVYLQATPEMLECGNQRFLKYFHKNIKNNGDCYE